MQGLLNAQRGFAGDGRAFLEPGETTLIDEVVWSLIIEGIVVPGSDDSNQGWPFLRLTEYGKRRVEANEILPHDPEGYLREFRRIVPSADPIVLDYLTESLPCFVRGLHRASAVMLGAASEMAVLALIRCVRERYRHTRATSADKGATWEDALHLSEISNL